MRKIYEKLFLDGVDLSVLKITKCTKAQRNSYRWLKRTQSSSKLVTPKWSRTMTQYTPGAPNVQHFFEEFVFCLVSPMCNSQDKHGFQSDKIDL